MIAGQRRPRKTLPTQSCIQRLPGARTGMGISVLDLPMPRVSPDLGALLRSIATRTPHLSLRESTLRAQDGPHSRIAATGFADGQRKSTATPRHDVIARALQGVRLSRLKILFIPEPGLAQHGGG